jgi:tRNA(Ile)-lysidine synthase
VELSTVLHFTEIDWLSEGRETNVTGAVLDRERLRGPLMLRNWQPGDRMRPAGHQKRHKLARLLNELGISRWEKAGWPVLTCGNEIVWARGLGAAAEFAADLKTRKGVHISEEKPL